MVTVASVSPPGSKASLARMVGWGSRPTSWWVLTSHSVPCLSMDPPAAIREPSGENATDGTHTGSALNVATCFPSAMRQSATSPSPPAAATMVPAGPPAVPPPVVAASQEPLPFEVERHRVEATVVAARHPPRDLPRGNVDQDRSRVGSPATDGQALAVRSKGNCRERTDPRRQRPPGLLERAEVAERDVV